MVYPILDMNNNVVNFCLVKLLEFIMMEVR